MSYVDAKLIGDTIHVAERVKGERRIRRYPAPYYFYVEDPDGKHESMYGNRLRRVDFKNGKEFRNAKKIAEEDGITLWESDIRTEFKLLEKEYADATPPVLNVAILDIESDARSELGWPRPETPYAAINAITIRRKWLGESITIALPPDNMTIEECEKALEGLENYFIAESEEELLLAVLDLLDDADVITGWNSEFYDLPYIIARMRIVLGGERIEDVVDDEAEVSPDSIQFLQRLCLFGLVPKRGRKEHYGEQAIVYELYGRQHMDYLALYQKFTFEEQFSYKLDYILKTEVNQSKVAYEGTLEQLYRNDFRLFCMYNRQDVDGLDALDEKLGFVQLANELAHMTCVLFPQTLGSVAIIEQGITLLLHKVRNQIAKDKFVGEERPPVAGAFVLEPVGGMYDWVASFDVNSLYPSLIRMLNISPETLVGQFDTSRTKAKLKNLIETKQADDMTSAWHHFTGVLEYHDIVDDGGNEFQDLTLNFEWGESETRTGSEWNQWFKDNPGFCLTANGTVFRYDEQGIIPYTLDLWYANRKDGQKKSKDYKKQAEIVKNTDKEEYKRLIELSKYWNRIQHVLKILLNSVYGSLLNEYFKFGDERFGQSTTLSGRVVTKHQCSEAGRIVSGTYGFTEDVLASDTDSTYVTISKLVASIKREDEIVDGKTITFEDRVVALADDIGRMINESYPNKMAERFFVTPERGSLIKAGREIVADRGLFKNAKKRYALSVIDKEGIRERDLKIMGMDTQRSDTPKWVQEFLKDCIREIVADGKDNHRLLQMISEFKEIARQRKPWTWGRPGRVSKLTIGSSLRKRFEEGKIPNPKLHYFVTASDNTNRLIEHHDERIMDRIRDGDKVEVIDLLKDPNRNPHGFKQVAIPVGIQNVPDWIKKLPFDIQTMEEKLIDQKIENTFGVLGWNLKPMQTAADDVFDF